MKTDAVEAIDLSAFLPQDQTEIDITTPAGALSGWKVTLAGPAHPQTIAANETAARKNLRREQQLEAQQRNGKKVKPDDRSPDEVRRENVEAIVERIVSWTPVRIGGEQFDFTRENAVRLLSKPEMGWAYVQIIEALADERSFTKASATT